MKGRWDETKGVVKQKVGKISGDRSTELAGEVDQVKGKLERQISRAKDRISRAGDLNG